MSAVACVYEQIDLAVLRTALQPIVALQDERVFAYEALLRVQPGDRGVAHIFDRVTDCRAAAELNLAAMRSALDAGSRLPEKALLFVNADPVVLANAQLPPALRAHGFPLSRLVVEITERSPFTDVAATTHVLGELRESGVRFALDDFGSAHSHLHHIDAIRPSFIKIGHGFGTAFQESATCMRIVQHIAHLARAFACCTILEGVESPTTALAGRRLGIEYAQGYHFGRPSTSFEKFDWGETSTGRKRRDQ